MIYLGLLFFFHHTILLGVLLVLSIVFFLISKFTSYFLISPGDRGKDGTLFHFHYVGEQFKLSGYHSPSLFLSDICLSLYLHLYLHMISALLLLSFVLLETSTSYSIKVSKIVEMKALCESRHQLRPHPRRSKTPVLSLVAKN